jgi:hypothetical protein
MTTATDLETTRVAQAIEALRTGLTDLREAQHSARERKAWGHESTIGMYADTLSELLQGSLDDSEDLGLEGYASRLATYR